MSDDRDVIVLVRRKGDVVAPTIGDISYGDLKIVVLERPRKPDPKDYIADGKPHPCIPEGDYDVDWTVGVHPKHPECYQTRTGPGTPAPDRSDILWHSANWIRELLGCHAPGLDATVVEGDYEGEHVRELGVVGSKLALARLIEKLGKKPFKLVIKQS